MYTFVVTSAFGIEKLVKNEIKRLGYQIVSTENGAITLQAPLQALAELNLHLRCAERVYLQLAAFTATSFDALYAAVYRLPWHDYLKIDSRFPVEAKSQKSALFSLSDIQSITKKAIVDQLKNHYQTAWFAESGTALTIVISIYQDSVKVLLDSSGAALHKRGYRKDSGIAPLKETTAAALVLLSDWYGDYPLIDPMCGSATLLIEAALLKRNIAPGLARSFAFEEWHFVDGAIYKKARQAAYQAIDYERSLQLYGADIDREAIRSAQGNAERAGVDQDIQFSVQDVRNGLPDLAPHTTLISNPPYGERLADRQAVAELYRRLGKLLPQKDNWSYFLLTAFEDFENVFAEKADRKRKLYNGKLKCYYYQYYADKAKGKKK